MLRAQLNVERNQHLEWKDFWLRPSLRKRCIIGFLVLFGAQGTATLVINSTMHAPLENGVRRLTATTDYGPSLYKSLGFGTVQQLLIQAGWITVCPFGNLINAFLVDRVGRVNMICKFATISRHDAMNLTTT